MGDRLSPGDTAPDFTLPDDTGTPVTLSDLRAPGCTTQACDFSDSLEVLKADGYVVLGISPDQPEKLARFREKDGLTIELLSDADRAVMTSWGAFGEKKLYGKTVRGVIRSTVVLDGSGSLSHAFYNVKATGHVAKLRRDLGLQ